MRASSSSEIEKGPLAAAWFDPRRSLGARLVWILLPIALLPVLVYWLVGDRLARKAELDLTARLVADARERERTELRLGTDRRAAEMEEQALQVVAVIEQAAALTARALREGPAPELPVEPLVDVPGGPLRTAGRGGSAAMISRATGLTAGARRDLAATRRLEAGFSQLTVGLPAVSAVFVATRSGVLRAVPWCDLSRLVEAGGRETDFLVPAGAVESPIVWSPVHDGLCARRGRIVSALTAVRGPKGEFLAGVGVDWAFEELFSREAGSRRPGEIELVLGPGSRTLLRRPPADATARHARDPRIPSIDETRLAGLTAKSRAVDLETALAGEPVLLSARQLREVGWTYVRILPLSVVTGQITDELDPVFRTSREWRMRMLAAYLGVMVVLAAVLVAASRRIVAPIRRVARFADAITGGKPRPELAATRRRDEVGRLARAMEELDLRVQRRIRSMEGMHDLARTASVMTRPDETFARLSRKIAELVGAMKSWISLWDAEARCLVFAPPGFGVSDDQLRGVKIPLNEHSLAMLAYQTGETYVSNELGSDPRISHRLADAVGVTENVVFVPLKTEAGTLGVLVVCDKPGGFDDEDLAAIQGYADEAALLLRNARLYEELQRSYERSRDAHRNRDYFLQNVNHELRTPLTAILGWSEILGEDRPDPETVATAVEQIRRSGEFLLTLISDLLDLARMEEAGVRLHRVPVDLGTMVADAVEPITVMAEGKGVTITIATPQKGEAVVTLDPVRMKQVLWNLVHNAVKFTHRGGRIDVEARAEGAEALFIVTDDGVGVDPKDLPFIFERFRQGDGSTTRGYRGTGIGLSLAKAFVELHGGTIEVESRPGRGARFLVRIPATPSGETAAPAAT